MVVTARRVSRMATLLSACSSSPAGHLRCPVPASLAVRRPHNNRAPEIPPCWRSSRSRTVEGLSTSAAAAHGCVFDSRRMSLVAMASAEPVEASVQLLEDPRAASADPHVYYGAARGAVPFASELNAKQLLTTEPAGAYTTMRTVGRTAIFDLGFHLDRLAESSRLMMEQEPSGVLDAYACLVDAATLRPLVLESIRAAIEQFEDVNPDLDPQGELRPTVLITWDSRMESYEILSIVEPLPPRPSSPVLVQIAGLPRSNAAAKNSEWVRERKVLEDSAPPGCNEVLLMGPDGDVREGLSSNFFALQDGALYTAEEGVLLGTVRDLVLKVAAREGIPVVLQPPNAAAIDRWEGAFVTSTSRLMLLADKVVVDAKEEPQVLEESPVLRRLEQCVIDEIAFHSESYL